MNDNSKQIVGFCDWKPHKKTQVILDQVDEILKEYEDYLPLTVR